MSTAVIFDMDGVIVHSESEWDAAEPTYLRSILEPTISEALIGKTRGLSCKLIYERAKELGYKGLWTNFFSGYDVLARNVYAHATITPGIDGLIGTLASKHVKLALVSSSPHGWITTVMNRLTNGHMFSYIESVNDHPELKPKPAPDGYVAAMRMLGVGPHRTIVIEDSQTGINAAIASSAHVIAFIPERAASTPHGVDTITKTVPELQAACDFFLASFAYKDNPRRES